MSSVITLFQYSVHSNNYLIENKQIHIMYFHDSIKFFLSGKLLITENNICRISIKCIVMKKCYQVLFLLRTKNNDLSFNFKLNITKSHNRVLG